MNKLIFEGQIRCKGRHGMVRQKDEGRMFWNEAACNKIPRLEAENGRIQIFPFLEVAKDSTLGRRWDVAVSSSTDVPRIESDQTQIEQHETGSELERKQVRSSADAILIFVMILAVLIGRSEFYKTNLLWVVCCCKDNRLKKEKHCN